MADGTIQSAHLKRAILKECGVTPDELVEQTLHMTTLAIRERP